MKASVEFTLLHVHPRLDDLLVIWAIAAGILLIVPLLSKKRSMRLFLVCLLMSALLPLIVAIVLLMLPFSFFRKKKKAEPWEKVELGAGHPVSIIKKYLQPEGHEKK